MSASLLDLPNEILSTTLSYLDSSWSEGQDSAQLTKPDLCALALSCRRLSSLAHSLIFRSISLQHKYLHYRDLAPTQEARIKLLIRTWRENPAYYLHSLQQVNCYKQSSDQGVPDEFFSYIAKSQSLSVLNLIDCFTEDVQRVTSYLHKPPSDPSFTSLRTLRIRPNARFFNYSDVILKLCVSPSLQHLELGSIGISTMINPKEAAALLASHANSSALESLHLSRKPSVEVDDLHLILSVCKNLKRLNIAPPAPGIKYDDGQRERFPETNRLFSSAAIVHALLPVAETLEDLAITDPEIIYYTQTDNTPLDLSAFTALKKLKVSSFVLAGGRHLSTQTGGGGGGLQSQSGTSSLLLLSSIWKILPPNLEELYVAFDSLNGVFYNLEGSSFIARGNFEYGFAQLWQRGPGSGVIFHKNVQWIMDLVEQKEKGDVLENLRRIELVECHTTQYLQKRYAEIRLKLCSLRDNYPDVFRRFERTGVRVDVLLYAPLGWGVTA